MLISIHRIKTESIIHYFKKFYLLQTRIRMKKNPDSEQLMKWLAKKDNRAFQYLYSQFYPSLFLLAKSYTKEDSLAEDMVQELFIHLLENRVICRTQHELKYYLYCLLKNRCIDFLRKQQVNHKYREEIIANPPEEEFFWDSALREEVYASLIEAIHSLPPQSRKVILYSLEGMKLSEIAEKLQISLYTVKEYKKSAIKRLSTLLKPQQYLLLLILGEL